jgi:NADH dehydrogenase
MARAKKKIIIIGGGFAGVNLAKHVLNYAPKRFSITLVDKNDYHLFTPGLFKAATSLKEPSVVFPAITINYEDIFKNQKIKILKSSLKSVDFKNSKVSLTGNKVLNYDYLVLAMGAKPDFKRVIGAEKFALPLKTFEDAIKIKSKIEDVLKHKSKRDQISIVIAGGGLTGTELAGQLNYFVDELAKKYSHPHGSVYLKVVQSGEHIIPTASSWMRKKIEERLRGLGVEILLNAKIKEIHRDKIIFQNGASEKYDILIWTIGVSPNINMDLSPTPTLRSGRHRNVFVIGDVLCNYNYPGAGSRGGTAQIAIDQAEYVANTIFKLNKITAPLVWHLRGNIPDYKPITSRFVNGIGKDYGLADLGLFKFKGKFACRLRNLIYLNYFTRILSLRKAFKVYKNYKAL